MQALDKFSLKVSAVLQNMNERLSSLEEHFRERARPHRSAPTFCCVVDGRVPTTSVLEAPPHASDHTLADDVAVVDKPAVDLAVIDGVNPAAQEAARQTLIALCQADVRAATTASAQCLFFFLFFQSDATLLALISDLDDAAALLALSRLTLGVLDRGEAGASDFGDLIVVKLFF